MCPTHSHSPTSATAQNVPGDALLEVNPGPFRLPRTKPHSHLSRQSASRSPDSATGLGGRPAPASVLETVKVENKKNGGRKPELRLASRFRQGNPWGVGPFDQAGGPQAGSGPTLPNFHHAPPRPRLHFGAVEHALSLPRAPRKVWMGLAASEHHHFACLACFGGAAHQNGRITKTTWPNLLELDIWRMNWYCPGVCEAPSASGMGFVPPRDFTSTKHASKTRPSWSTTREELSVGAFGSCFR